MRYSCLLGLGAAAIVAAQGMAAIVQIDVYGVVDFNVIQGSHAGIPSGSPVHMGFQVDSSIFTNSASFPTRGYSIDVASFNMQVGNALVLMDNPQPGPAYFVLRNNDPGVDGFFLSSNTDVFSPLDVHIPGLNPTHELDFHTTYPATTLSSLDILDAVGSYDLTGLSVYQWTIGRFGNPGAEYAYQRMTITVVPAPAGAALLAMAGIVGARRRRSR